MKDKTVNRIKQYLDAKSISLNAFDKAIEAGNGYLGKQLKRNASIGSDVVEKIVCIYPDLNPTWLVTGRGNMFIPLESTGIKNTYTPEPNSGLPIVSEPENAKSLHPKNNKTLHPTLHPTQNLGVPKVITVNEKNEDLVSLVSAKAAAGYLNGYADAEYIEHLPTIKLPNLKGGTHRAFEIKGHSMNPTIHNGAIAVGRWVESFADIKENYVYIIVTKTDGIVCKRVLNRIEESGRLILKSDNANKKEYPNIILNADDVVELWRLRGGFIFEFAEPNEVNQRINDLEANYTLMQEQLKKLLK